MTDDLDTELAEVQARINELERTQEQIRERIKSLRSREVRLHGKEGREARESACSAIDRAMEAVDTDAAGARPRGDVVETALGMAPHHSQKVIESALAGMERRGEVYEPTKGKVKYT